MLSRREKLLIRPWQQRRYNHHRRKVQCALPAIDVGPPPTRSHVCCKLKKQQSEQERRAQIEEDNCRLLQRMGTIMRTSRLDNHWVNPPPNFLQRVGIYYLPAECDSFNQVSPPNEASNKNRRCLACNPQKITTIEAQKSGMQQSKGKEAGDTAPRHITLTRGGLQLAVSYPANTTITLKDGQFNRALQREYCECKARSVNKKAIKLQ